METKKQLCRKLQNGTIEFNFDKSILDITEISKLCIL